MCAGGDRRDRADGDPAVDDRDAVAALDLAADGPEPAGVADQALADPATERLEVGRGARLEVDAHRHRADVELVLPDHAERGQDVLSAMQRRLLAVQGRPDAHRGWARSWRGRCFRAERNASSPWSRPNRSSSARTVGRAQVVRAGTPP